MASILSTAGQSKCGSCGLLFRFKKLCKYMYFVFRWSLIVVSASSVALINWFEAKLILLMLNFKELMVKIDAE